MEFVTNNDFYTKFGNQFALDNCYTFDALINNFDSVAPQIEFEENVSLIDTLKKYYEIIGSYSTAYLPTWHPYYIFDFINHPENFHTNNNRNGINFLEGFLRQQGSIYTQIYYCVIFMIEVLNREEDAICSKSAKIPLHYQIYYETYIFDVIFKYYVHNHTPTFKCNMEISEKYKLKLYESYSDPLSEESINLEKLRIEVTSKFVSLVEHHFCRLKSKLLDKCKQEEITPTRALWLCFVPLTYEELNIILENISNKYIRSSLFFAAGFQMIPNIDKLIKNDIELNAYNNGYDSKKKHMDDNFDPRECNNSGIATILHFYFRDDFNNSQTFTEKRDIFYDKYKNSKISEDIMDTETILCGYNTKYYSFYPFYSYSKVPVINNWILGCSQRLEFIEEDFSKIGTEYLNYYSDQNCKTTYFLDENEDNGFVKYKDIIISKF